MLIAKDNSDFSIDIAIAEKKGRRGRKKQLKGKDILPAEITESAEKRQELLATKGTKGHERKDFIKR